MRISVGLTQAELAELAGIALNTLNQIESGKKHYKVHQTTAEALSSALYVPVNQLFESTELSDLGRPAHTGTRCVYSQNSASHEAICDNCNLMYITYIGCRNCVTSAV